MNYVSLFSGIGGMDLGLDRAGMTCVAQVERDPYCQKVLARHWPDVPRFDDVCTFARTSINETTDLVAGGFPCQPHSLAGKRQGSADERDLWGEFARIIGEFEPRWLFIENVPGLLSSDRGRFFGNVLRELAAFGFNADWQVLSAAAFGASHRRERVWLVAHHQSLGVERVWPERFEEPRPLDKALLSVRHRDGQWKAEPDLCRTSDGISGRAHRLKAIGNAVVPAIAQYIGALILAADARVRQEEQAT